MVGKVPDGAQEGLYVVAEQSGQLEPRNFDPEQPLAVSLIERDIHLQNVAALLSKVSQYEGLIMASRTERRGALQAQYGERTDQVVEGADQRRAQVLKAAKWEFMRAFGFVEVEEVVGTDSAKEAVAKSFRHFDGKFGHAHNAIDRLALQAKLRVDVAAMQDRVTIQNREAGERPHHKEATNEDGQKLNTQERLEAIVKDPRAGFIPTTNREKNVVISFLDYLDNPSYPMGINNQLFEVYRNRANATHFQTEGERAMRSIAYELTDYLRNAATQLNGLRDLELAIHECDNPFISLAEDIGAEHAGYAPLVRFLDLRERMETGKVAGLKRDSLRTRTIREGHDPRNKRKTVEDRYTAEDLEPIFAKRIAKRVGELTIGEMRGLIGEAVVDQEKRFAFMYARLEDAAVKSGHRRDFTNVRRISRQALRKLDEAA